MPLLSFSLLHTELSLPQLSFPHLPWAFLQPIKTQLTVPGMLFWGACQHHFLPALLGQLLSLPTSIPVHTTLLILLLT